MFEYTVKPFLERLSKMDPIWSWLFYIALIAVVILVFVAIKKHDDKLWIKAADPDDENHWFWLQAQNIENEKERKKVFLAAVYKFKKKF